MTEIPEYLLKRAQARRAELTGQGAAPADSDAPAPAADEAAPAAAAPAAVEKPAPPVPTLADSAPPAEPDIPVVAAAKSRRKIPYWAAPVLLLLPVWGWIYAESMTESEAVETDPIVIGEGVFNGNGGCAGCHGGDGAGGPAGAQLNEGHTLETFADPLSMVHWVAYGFSEGAHDNGTYGDVNRPQITGAMPGFAGNLTNEEIASVVIYIRSEMSPDEYDPENEMGFTPEGYEENPQLLADQVQEVIDLGPGGEPDLEGVTRPEG